MVRSVLPFFFLAGALLVGCSFNGGGVSLTGDRGVPHADLSHGPDRAIADGAATRDTRVDARSDIPPKKPDAQTPDAQTPDAQTPDARTPDAQTPDLLLPPCPLPEIRCAGSCVDLAVSTSHCGQCDKACSGGQTCDNGLCCNTGLTNCGGVCVDTRTDAAHCNGCNTACPALWQCVASGCVNTSGCADGSDEQLFTQGMRGCAGVVVFSQRATLCAAGFRVCSAAEWVARRNGVAPTYNYWTNNALDYYGSGSGNCYAVTQDTGGCNNGTPIRVCAASTDPLGNECNWTHCGFNSAKPDQYFGGCNGNPTAGTLCCPP